MNPVIAHCPICREQLSVTCLHCQHCDTRIEGRFTLGRLYQLLPAQLEFVELFLRCEGKINRVGQELNMSYPAVRARLTDVIEALGYEVDEMPALTPAERREILAQVSAGELTSAEAAQLLKGE